MVRDAATRLLTMRVRELPPSPNFDPLRPPNLILRSAKRVSKDEATVAASWFEPPLRGSSPWGFEISRLRPTSILSDPRSSSMRRRRPSPTLMPRSTPLRSRRRYAAPHHEGSRATAFAQLRSSPTPEPHPEEREARLEG